MTVFSFLLIVIGLLGGLMYSRFWLSTMPVGRILSPAIYLKCILIIVTTVCMAWALGMGLVGILQ